MRDVAKSRAGRSWSWPGSSSERDPEGGKHLPVSRCSCSLLQAGCGSVGSSRDRRGIDLLVLVTTWAAAALGGLWSEPRRVGWATRSALIPLQLVFFVAVVWLRGAVVPAPGVTLSARPVAWDWEQTPPAAYSRSSTALRRAGEAGATPEHRREARSAFSTSCHQLRYRTDPRGCDVTASSRMERRGWVVRADDPDDGRSALLPHRDRGSWRADPLVRRGADRRVLGVLSRQVTNCELSWPRWCGCRRLPA